VAFFTLFERKVLGYIHLRKGPNKVGWIGIFQPFRDAIKLFTKTNLKIFKLNYYVYVARPFWGMLLVVLLWGVFPVWGLMVSFFIGFIFLYSFMSLGVYFLLGCGWSSNRKYRVLGAYRAVSQTISYEVRMILVSLGLLFFLGIFNLMRFGFFQRYYWFALFSLPLFMVWFSICLRETNRSPYDFSEGESELVSGFNTEYSGGLFSLIFICEYTRIIFLAMFSVILFVGGMDFIYLVKVLFLCYVFLWVRGRFPRFRYDKLMIMAWKDYLPFSIAFLVMILGLVGLVL